jgi:aryl-alcohol dehydrogenase-like predicted oxidoreductase
MKYRPLGRTGWSVSEIGYGMWGLGSWSGSDDQESLVSLRRSVELGCNFFDTAFAYGEGRSERLLGQLVREYPNQKLYTASKIPPKNRQWAGTEAYTLDEVFPADYIIEMMEKSLKNLGLEQLDLMQFHCWNDDWSADERWQRAVEQLKTQGKIRSMGISINRWEPANGIKALRTGLIDAVQVIYNIFDQNPEDELYPVCEELNVGVIARVPFDEGSLIDNLTLDSHWPNGDWRNIYFTPENLRETLPRVEALRPLVPPGMSMAEMALRFTLADQRVSTVIPGMRKLSNVEKNIAASDGKTLPPALVEKLRPHRWVRVATPETP